MQLSELSEQQLNAFIKNYEASGKTEGGIFPLADLKLEKLRRNKPAFPPRDVADAIVRLARVSSDGLVSYKQIWEVFRPDRTWIGNAPRAEMAKALGSVIAYCVDNKLPILTTLVVRAGSRSQSDEAIDNIYNEAKSLGVDVGISPKAFVLEEQAAARLLTPSEFK